MTINFEDWTGRRYFKSVKFTDVTELPRQINEVISVIGRWIINMYEVPEELEGDYFVQEPIIFEIKDEEVI